MSKKQKIGYITQKYFSNLKLNIKKLMTKRNQGILFFLTVIAAIASIYAVITDKFPQPINITLYSVAGLGLICTCVSLVKAIIFFIKVIWLPFTKRNHIANTLITDNKLRTVLITLPGMILNMIYAVFNCVIAVVNASAWYDSLSTYYFLLCAMRFLSVSYARKIYNKNIFNTRLNEEKITELEEKSWRVHKNCGVILSVTSIALGGAVIVLVLGEGGKSYPGLMIYMVATYTFYKLIMSIRNMIMARKEKSVLLITLRNISYSDALVSLLSLQTALFAAFGQDSQELIPIMNTLTGAGVCLMIFLLGIYMVHKSNKILKILN